MLLKMGLSFSKMFKLLLLGAIFVRLALAKRGVKPAFKKGKTNYTVKIKKTVRMRCDLARGSGVTITWLKNGTAIDVGKRKSRIQVRRKKKSRLRIVNAHREDTGEYECRAKNKYGTAHYKIWLNVTGRTRHPLQGPPYFTKVNAPRFLAWPASSNMKLKCEAEGERPLKYKWLKDGKPFKGRHLDPRVNTTRWYLKIKTTVPSDNGQYTCIVSNRLGNISRNYQLSIVQKPRSKPILSKVFPKNKTVKTGSNVTFHCVELITSGLAVYRWIKWKKVPKILTKSLEDPSENNSDVKIISAMHYDSISMDGDKHGVRVHLTNVSKEDEGLYTCMVSNQIGKNFRSAFLTINDRGLPYFTKVNTPRFVARPTSSNINLKCNAEGERPLKYKWLKDGKPFEGRRFGPRVNTTRWYLRIRNTVPSDNGQYTCIVANRLGSISRSYHLSVVGR